MTLELLPPEIKLLILCNVADIEALQAIVHASPDFHETYRHAREAVLHDVTMRTLRKHGNDILDPLTALHVTKLVGEAKTREVVHKIIEDYLEQRMHCGDRLGLEDSLIVLRLYHKFSILIQHYCESNLMRTPLEDSARVRSNTTIGRHKIPQPSEQETQRIFRALWRWQTYSKLFPEILLEDFDERALNPEQDEDEIAATFFGLFPVHEVEEIACLHSYALNLYRECDSSLNVYGLVTLGPEALYGALKASLTSQCREFLIANSSVWGPSMRDVLNAYERVLDGGFWPWVGENQFLSGDRSPTVGWLWASSRGVQNTDLKLRRWGYVFWDRERLDEWGITTEHMLNWPWSKEMTRVLP